MSSKKTILVSVLFLAIAISIGYVQVTAELQPSQSSPAALPRAAGPMTLFVPMVGRSFRVPSPLWRFGFAQARLSPTVYNDDIVDLRFGWYVDYNGSASNLTQYRIEYVPMVRVKQWKVNPDGSLTSSCWNCAYATPPTYTVSMSASQIQSRATSQPGMIWAVGNEMDRRDWSTGGQDEMVPELYAQAYNYVYNIIKNADPTAQVAIGGVVQASPLRLQYLDSVWNTYATLYGQNMPVDIWNVHAFILQEKSCTAYPTDCWGAGIPAGSSALIGLNWPDYYSTVLANKDFNNVKTQIVALRTWMQQHGLQSKPLFVTEYGVLYSDWAYPGHFLPSQVRDEYMYPSFNYFLNQTDSNIGYPADGNRLVQRWIWYSLDDDSRFLYQGTMYDNFNGYLYHTGLEGVARGMTEIGGYWKQYVQSLGSAENRPY